MKGKAKADLLGKTISQKLDKGDLVETGLTGNPNFTIPVSIMDGFTDSKSELSAAKSTVDVKKQEYETAVSVQTTKETNFDTKFTAVVNSVNSQSSDADIILTTGLDLVDEASAPPALLAPQNFNVTEGDDAGENDLAFDPIKGATGIVIQKSVISVPPPPGGEPPPPIEAQWETVRVLGKVSKCTIVTEPGEFAWWRVYGVRGNEIGPKGNPVAKISPY